MFRLRRKAGFFVYKGKDGGSSFDRAAATAKADAVFLTLLQTYDDQGRRVSPNPGANYAPAMFERDDAAEGVTSKALAKAMGRLLKENRIHIEKIGSVSRQRDKLTPGPAKEAPEGEEARAND